jgi:hypothetical protein
LKKRPLPGISQKKGGDAQVRSAEFGVENKKN